MTDLPKVMLAEIITQNDYIQALTIADDLSAVLAAYNRLKWLFSKHLCDDFITSEHSQAWAMIDLFAFSTYQDMVYYKATEASDDYRVALVRFKDRVNQAVSLLP